MASELEIDWATRKVGFLSSSITVWAVSKLEVYLNAHTLDILNNQTKRVDVDVVQSLYMTDFLSLRAFSIYFRVEVRMTEGKEILFSIFTLKRAFCETGGFLLKILVLPSFSNLLRGIGRSPDVVAVAGAYINNQPLQCG
jgi:hypothetical protein